MKLLVLDYSIDELRQKFKDIGLLEFRANQVYQSALNGLNIEDVCNIPFAEKERLLNTFENKIAEITHKKTSKDGTIKMLVQLCCGNAVEAVIMKYKNWNTLCVSTQVGCSMGCKFCASTIGGKVRDLSSGEIMMQYVLANKLIGGDAKNRKITNVVLMGCGEPLDNYDNVIKFIKLLTSEQTFNISRRNITLSTCGIVDNIIRLADEQIKISLAISLHAPNDQIRKKLMPIARKYSIEQIVNAADNYYKKTGRQVSYEYTLCKDVNDSEECALELAKLLKDKHCHVNIINLSKVEGRETHKTSKQKCDTFIETLKRNGVSATIRRSLGADIDGACGQLRKKMMGENNES